MLTALTCSLCVQLKSFHNELLTQLEQKVELDARYLSVSTAPVGPPRRSPRPHVSRAGSLPPASHPAGSRSPAHASRPGTERRAWGKPARPTPHAHSSRAPIARRCPWRGRHSPVPAPWRACTDSASDLEALGSCPCAVTSPQGQRGPRGRTLWGVWPEFPGGAPAGGGVGGQGLGGLLPSPPWLCWCAQTGLPLGGSGQGGGLSSRSVVFASQAALKKYQTEQRSKGDALDKCQAELKKLRKKSQGSKNPQKYSDKELQVGLAPVGTLEAAVLRQCSPGRPLRGAEQSWARFSWRPWGSKYLPSWSRRGRRGPAARRACARSCGEAPEGLLPKGQEPQGHLPAPYLWVPPLRKASLSL